MPSLTQPALRSASEELHRNLTAKEIPSLNGIRAISAYTVVLWHFQYSLISGGYGVTMFFVLSGLLITHLLIRESQRSGTVSLKSFYIRRSLRIFPAFYVFAAIYIGGRLLKHMYMDWPQVWASLFYVRNYYQAIFHPVNGVLAHTWSLGVEEQFYLLWPFIFKKFCRSPKSLMKGLAISIVCVWVYRAILSASGVSYDYIYNAFDTRFDSLGVGCLAALAIHNRVNLDVILKNWILSPLLIASIVVLNIIQARVHAFNFQAVVMDAVLPVFFCILLLQAVRFADYPIFRLLNTPVMRYLGMISYSTYLYHVIVAHIAGAHPTGFKLLIALGACSGAAMLSYHIVEKPMLRLRQRFEPAATTVAKPVASGVLQPEGT